MFPDFYGQLAREHMQKHGSTLEHFAMIVAKNSFHGSLNFNVQFSNVMSVEEVSVQPVVSPPLTWPMICPLADGDSAVVVVSERKGHPVGATGLAQVAEIVLQLQGRAGGREVQGARTVLTFKHFSLDDGATPGQHRAMLDGTLH